MSSIDHVIGRTISNYLARPTVISRSLADLAASHEDSKQNPNKHPFQKKQSSKAFEPESRFFQILPHLQPCPIFSIPYTPWDCQSGLPSKRPFGVVDGARGSGQGRHIPVPDGSCIPSVHGYVPTHHFHRSSTLRHGPASAMLLGSPGGARITWRFGQFSGFSRPPLGPVGGGE